MKILELFGGIGACSKALDKLGINYEIADYVEIDKYAVKSFNAIHGTNFEPQDICQWDKDIEVDLIMHGSPCQDFSAAGKNMGGNEGSGTRSSLMFETLRIVEKLKPKYVIWENVKNVLSKTHIHNFDAYLKQLETLGYSNCYQVLNAKDYGIPQNRERIFVVSIRNDIDNKEFSFPKPVKLQLTVQDLLEKVVDEKYYLSEAMKKYIMANNEKWTGNNGKSLINKSIASTINTAEGQRRCDASNYIAPDIDKENIDLKSIVIYDDYNSRIRQDQNTIGTLTCNIGSLTPRNSYKLIECGQELKIRKLTPKECWRLMGFEDEDCDKAALVNSNTQLYKQAGNSICVSVIEAILRELLGGNN